MQDYLEVYLFWQGEKFNKERLQKYKINSDNSFYLEDAILSLTTPMGVILDQNQKVIFFSENMENLTNKLITLDGIEEEMLRGKANRYLFNQGKGESQERIIYFSMKGCSDCKVANDILKDIEQVNGKMITIYDEPAYGEGKLIDINGFFSKIYGLDWYPSFLILDNEKEISWIGKIDSSQIKECILKAIQYD